MTNDFILNWAVMAVSLFNTVLLLWLGLTVILNADRRLWGIWLAGGGLLLGGAFFVSHSAILGIGIKQVSKGMDFWWHVGWVPVIALPFAWYVVMLWYAGFWDDTRQSPVVSRQSSVTSRQSPVASRQLPGSNSNVPAALSTQHSALHRRQRPWLFLASLLALATVWLAVVANPLPSYSQVVALDLSPTPSISGIPLLVLVYPAYALLCMFLSLDVLRHPGPTGRVMGDLARRRARPWLAAASFVLVLVSLLVGGAILWIVLNAREYALYNTYSGGMADTVAWLDLFISSLIALAIILLGQAIVSYEIFTGKALPRRGLLWQWRNAVILAAGYGALVSLSLALNMRPVYSLLLTTVLMILFFALYSWNAYAERAQYIGHLRPFVTSQRLYDYLLAPEEPKADDGRWTMDDRIKHRPSSVVHRPSSIAAPFNALCSDVLNVKVAYLAALGPLSPLVGAPLAYPEGNGAKLAPLSEISTDFDSQGQALCVPVDSSRYGGAIWAVPLWGERGLIGVMLLGEKRDGGLFTQEEIEIARASGERLIDTQASVEMAQRLMTLQRRRMVEIQVLDRRARRVLHDDVLPQLHTAMLALSGQSPVASRQSPVVGNQESGIGNRDKEGNSALELLAGAHRQISDLLREMPPASAPEVARLGLVGALRRAIEQELVGAFDEVNWEVEPDAARRAGDMPPVPAEVVFYAAREAMRNAARYGRGDEPSRPLHLLVAVRWRDGLEVLVEDDGVGIGTVLDRAEVRSPGSSGQGLALHSTMMAVVGGTLSTESLTGKYTRVLLTLPEGNW